MRILIVAPHPFYQERGTPIAVRLLAETLCSQGHDVDILTYHEGEDLPDLKATVHRIPSFPLVRNVPIGFSWKKVLCDIGLTFKLWKMTQGNRYDVLHAVEEAIFPCALLRRLRRIRLVYDMDSSLVEQMLDTWKVLGPLNRILCRFEKAAIANSDLVVAVCTDLAVRAREYGTATPVKVIEDISMISDGPDDLADDIRQIAATAGPIALYVGNLEPYQGIGLLLDAMAEVGDEAALDLVVIGGNEEGIRKYSRYASELGIEKKVHFIGPRPLAHLGAYLRQADILASPRLTGHNTPMKLYSYLGSGKAILATRIRSHTQVLDDTCAVLVEPSATDMADGLRRLIGDRELRGRLGAKALELARSRFSLAQFQRSINEAYDDLAAAPAP